MKKSLSESHKKNISISVKRTLRNKGIKGTVQKNGYREFRERNQKVLTRGYEHRIVMEAHLKRKLRREETVHHINGNKLDNRLENLEVISNSEHARMHALENGLGKHKRK